MQSMSRTPGVGGKFMTVLPPPTTSAYCSFQNNPYAGDVALTSGDDAIASSWVVSPALLFVSCTQVGVCFALTGC